MSDYVPKRSNCLNCYKKFGDTREILQGADGTWVHNNRHYDLKCNPFHSYVAEPREEQ